VLQEVLHGVPGIIRLVALLATRAAFALQYQYNNPQGRWNLAHVVTDDTVIVPAAVWRQVGTPVADTPHPNC